jgi:hypothetical protein
MKENEIMKMAWRRISISSSVMAKNNENENEISKKAGVMK